MFGFEDYGLGNVRLRLVSYKENTFKELKTITYKNEFILKRYVACQSSKCVLCAVNFDIRIFQFTTFFVKYV